MDTGVIVALILGAANIISAVFFGWIPSRNRAEIQKLESKNNTLSNNLSFFIEEEKLLLQLLSETNSRTTESIKREIRKKVVENTGKHLDESYRPSHY